MRSKFLVDTLNRIYVPDKKSIFETLFQTLETEEYFLLTYSFRQIWVNK